MGSIRENGLREGRTGILRRPPAVVVSGSQPVRAYYTDQISRVCMFVGMYIQSFVWIVT